MTPKRVVITGLGALTPLGNTVEEFWEGLLAGKSGAGPITRFDASKFKTQFACEVKGFDAEAVLGKRYIQRTDVFINYALVASDQAIADAKLTDYPHKEDVGVLWASGIGGLVSLQNEIFTFAKGDGSPRFSPMLVPRMIVDAAPGHISIRNGFRGLTAAIVTACASSTHALSLALDQIRLGRANVIVVGGSEAAISPAGVGGFNALGALSTFNEDPQKASRPYDKDRTGFVLGEGAGALVVEEYEHAKARGAKIYAELAGSGLCSDGYHITAPDPSGAGAERVMRLALANAGMRAEDIQYINTHGTSTDLGDVMEVKAICQAFGEAAYGVNISSTKSMTGHLLGAAGAIEAVATVLAVQRDIVPPTINLDNLDPALDAKLNFTAHKPQSRTVHAAMSNNFGFGGHNSCAIFKKI